LKKLLLLGGSRYLLPVIREAKAMGLHTITCDYLPENIAHRYSDEYHNVSITDLEATLALARQLKVDGVMSFACDPGVVTAAYVAEKMGLPNVGPLESVRILQDKGRFRAFLRDHGFRVPWVRSFETPEEALAAAESLQYPLMVKPTDSAGSKGVSRVDRPEDLPAALQGALEYSRNGRLLLEGYLPQQGFSSDTDCFSVDGELKFVSFNNQYFDRNAENPYTPTGYTWPSTMPVEKQAELRAELQRLLRLLNMGTALYNIETRCSTDGEAYIMEVSPRGGGNRLSEMLEYTSGTRLVHNAVRAALGLPVEEMHDPVYQGHWSIVMLHAERSGTFRKLWIAEDARASVVEEDLWVNPGDPVEAFAGANNAVGSLVLNWPSEAERDARMADVSSWARILTEGEQDA
jgi:biotin carboxylase